MRCHWLYFWYFFFKLDPIIDCVMNDIEGNKVYTRNLYQSNKNYIIWLLVEKNPLSFVCVCVCVCVHARARAPSLSHVRLLVISWTVAYHTPLSVGFSGQEYWRGLLVPPPGDLPDPGVKPTFPVSSALARWILYHSATWEALSFL